MPVFPAPAVRGIGGRSSRRLRGGGIENQADRLHEHRPRHFLLARQPALEALRSGIERVAERVDPAAPLDRAAQGHHRHVRVAHPAIMTRYRPRLVPSARASSMVVLTASRRLHMSMPSMPPMPPMPPWAWPPFFSSTNSATIASVVSMRPATDAAFCSAVRATLVGSITPISTISPNSSVWALKPKLPLFSSTLLSTTEGSAPELSTMMRSG